MKAKIMMQCKLFGHDSSCYMLGSSTRTNGYTPWNFRSSIMRYWKLLKQFYESDIASARSCLIPPDCRIMPDLELLGWADRMIPPGGWSAPFEVESFKLLF